MNPAASGPAATEVVIEIAGKRYHVADPEIVAHVQYFAEHVTQLRLGSMRAYQLTITRTPDGTAYATRNDSLPYVRRALRG
jgi:hypothetical protein